MASGSIRMLVSVGNPRLQSEDFFVKAFVAAVETESEAWEGDFGVNDDFSAEGKVEAAVQD
eukprot:scaffold4883_cov143-Pinguiococcus_pyrenoidosus.AAC.1